jgi:hypothetical protein
VTKKLHPDVGGSKAHLDNLFPQRTLLQVDTDICFRLFSFGRLLLDDNMLSYCFTVFPISLSSSSSSICGNWASNSCCIRLIEASTARSSALRAFLFIVAAFTVATSTIIGDIDTARLGGSVRMSPA